MTVHVALSTAANVVGGSGKASRQLAHAPEGGRKSGSTLLDKETLSGMAKVVPTRSLAVCRESPIRDAIRVFAPKARAVIVFAMRDASFAQASMVNDWLTSETRASAMRIDSGLNSYYYQNRYVPISAEGEDSANEQAPVTTSRLSGSGTFSSSLLSNSLASTLWVVDGGRKPVPSMTQRTSSASSSDDRTAAQKVEDVYREYDVTFDDYDA
ncbi:hypothetical protein J5N58_17810 [Rhizobium cremeum]|uniref:hypothetical protein n=1 Tax=Rhizobium cremeum TaxID=2813827 RepID=UPI001FD421B6|nr:hypothetical protein [Rhizobium cremeum]MCJ7996279.1 hypothetical protein [Rhizobium cremeum]MCJ8001538.1 hypothetical protein [Rhizobium cremeum]